MVKVHAVIRLLHLVLFSLLDDVVLILHAIVEEHGCGRLLHSLAILQHFSVTLYLEQLPLILVFLIS